MKLFHFEKIPQTTLFLLLIVFLTRVGFFMALPFLAIYLARENIFSAGQIGTILGAAALFYSVTSLINGMIIERFAKKSMLIFSLIIATFCYEGISFFHQSFWALFLLNGALGWIRSMGDITSTTILVQHADETNLRSSYNLRFIAVNAGAMIGPLIGAALAYQQSLLIFMIAGIIHFALAVYLFFMPLEEKRIAPENYSPNIFNHLNTLFGDKRLLLFTLINLLIWLIYSQLDTTLPQYLTYTTQHPAFIMGMMLFINAFICIAFSNVALRLTALYSLKYAGLFGSFLMTLGFILIVVSPTFFSFACVALLTSAGELFTILSNGLVVSQIAPKHLISSYNGFFNLSSFGLCFGPILGGWGLQLLGGKETFLLLTLFPLLCCVLYARTRHTINA